MPRPVKCRKVCHFPQILEFAPVKAVIEKEPVILSVDEYESIRLIDKEGLSQEQCGAFMQIARTTVQRIYENARKKLADSIVDGRPLRIEGGDFWVCDGRSMNCGHNGCFKHLYHQQYEKMKSEGVLRVTIPYENGQIFPHFGHSRQFKIYDISDQKIFSSEIIDTNGSGHGALVGVLNALNTDVLICGCIGSGAQAALTASGMKLYGGVSGDADQAVAAWIAGNLQCNLTEECDCHCEEGHNCDNC